MAESVGRGEQAWSVSDMCPEVLVTLLLASAWFSSCAVPLKCDSVSSQQAPGLDWCGHQEVEPGQP